METNNAIKALNNLYGLLLEMNYYKEPIDFVDEITEEDKFVSKHLKSVMLRRAKTKAFRAENRYAKLREEFLRLKEYGFEKLKELLTANERVELQPFFSKYTELDEKDEIDINDDQDFLVFISKLRDKIENNDSE